MNNGFAIAIQRSLTTGPFFVLTGAASSHRSFMEEIVNDLLDPYCPLCIESAQDNSLVFEKFFNHMGEFMSWDSLYRLFPSHVEYHLALKGTLPPLHARRNINFMA